MMEIKNKLVQDTQQVVITYKPNRRRLTICFIGCPGFYFTGVSRILLGVLDFLGSRATVRHVD